MQLTQPERNLIERTRKLSERWPKTRWIAVTAAVLVTSILAGPAQDWTRSPQDWTQNLYASVDIGAIFQPDTTLYQSYPSPTTANASFNPGIRGDIALGYNITRSLAAEFDTGVLWNSMDSLGGIPLSSDGLSFDTYTVPIMANIVYKVPLTGPWSPYLGVGIGGAAAIVSYDVGGSTPTTVGDCDFVFAYSVEAGLKYKLTKNACIGIAYKFFGMMDPSWNLVVPTVPGSLLPAANYHFKEEDFYIHSIVVSFTWNF
jgi:opacity protein-like surface antigen